MKKKIILFIVEGLSDKNALDPILSEIIDESFIHFDVTHGDITSNYTLNTPTTIVSKIETIVNSYLTKRSFHIDDLLEVILLTDTDGTFINANNIEYHDKNNVFYEDTKILTTNIKGIQMRNIIKSQILEKLSNIKNLTIRNEPISFKTFYMSCNLDHVLHNERNMTIDKIDKAYEFADSFEGRENEFIDFVKRFMIRVDDNYKESWENIQKSNNSLLRYSNLWLYLKKYR